MTAERFDFFMLCPNVWWGGAQIATFRVAQWFARQQIPVKIVVSRIDGKLPFSAPSDVLVDLKVPTVKIKGKPIAMLLALTSVGYLARYLLYLLQTRPLAVIGSGYDGWAALLGAQLAKDLTYSAFWEQAHITARCVYASSIQEHLTPLIAQFYRMASIIASCSQSVADDLIRFLRLPQEKVHIIHNPIAPDIFERAQEPVDHPWFKNSKIPVILCVARLDPQKDLPTLIRAFSIVRKERPARLAILGEGSERAKLEALVKELGLEGDVWMPGFVDNPFKFMKRATVFALSSKFEGFGMVIAEALAVGTPVVSTDCPSGPAEILGGGKWGKLVPVGDHEKLAEAILETIENPPDREKLKERGRDFSIDEVGGKWLKVIQDVTQP
jgi:glycosyltransferase involved in cell wall biosynthesis